MKIHTNSDIVYIKIERSTAMYINTSCSHLIVLSMRVLHKFLLCLFSILPNMNIFSGIIASVYI